MYTKDLDTAPLPQLLRELEQTVSGAKALAKDGDYVYPRQLTLRACELADAILSRLEGGACNG
jgi:hypothetical protein